MATDRDSTLRRAEKLLRQGRLDAAIAEYVRVVEDQPRDWNTANLLGDLYVRAGQIERAAAQYVRIAEHLAREGFVPKASALYKKVVKIKPDDEPALLRASELAQQQGLTADARAHLVTLYQQRVRKGDRLGAAQAALKLAMVDPGDLAARLNAARAASEAGDTAGATSQYRDLAADFDLKGQPGEAIEALAEAVRLDPVDEPTRERLVRACLSRGDIEQARRHASSAADLRVVADELLRAGREGEALEMLTALLTADPSDVDARLRIASTYVARGDIAQAGQALTAADAGDHPQLLLTLAEIELRAHHFPEATSVLRGLLDRDPGHSEPIIALGHALARVDPQGGYECIATVADLSVAAGEFEQALAVLERFVDSTGGTVAGLLKLIEVCVDGGYEHNLYRAQARLADAYLAEGRWVEARTVAEDLLDRRPDDDANTERLRRALVGLGETNADEVVAERLRRRLQPDDLNDFVESVNRLTREREELGGAGLGWRPGEQADFPEPSAAAASGGTQPELPTPAAGTARADAEPDEPPHVEADLALAVGGVGPDGVAGEAPDAGLVLEEGPTVESGRMPTVDGIGERPSDELEEPLALETVVVPAVEIVELPVVEEHAPPPTAVRRTGRRPTAPPRPAEGRGTVPFELTGAKVDLEDALADVTALAADSAAAPTPAGPEAIEIDLSGALDALLVEGRVPQLEGFPADGVSEESVGQEPAAPAEPVDAASAVEIEGLVEQLRADTARAGEYGEAARLFAQGRTYHAMGLLEEAAQALQIAVRTPAVRFGAATLLGKIARESGRPLEAVEWFEQAAGVPAPSPTDTQALLYDLADTLDGLRERARALAVFIELQAAAPGYRDVAHRIEWLSDSQAEP